MGISLLQGVLLLFLAGPLTAQGIAPSTSQVGAAMPALVTAPGGGSTHRGAPVWDPRIDAIVNQVSAANIDTWVQNLVAIPSRYSNSPGAVIAQNMIEAEFQSLGIATRLEFFGSSSMNVVGEIPGVGDPSKIILIGAHYDSFCGNCDPGVDPGADDNASGTAGVLEAARVLASGGPYTYTLRFIAFSGEEQGLLGSEFSADRSLTLGEDIIAMLNMDMIAYRAPGDARDAAYYGDTNLRAICETLSAMYVPNWVSEPGNTDFGASDHWRYRDNGYATLFCFEDRHDYFPSRHTSLDSYPNSTNDFDLAAMIVGGVVASSADLAQPVNCLITHTPVSGVQPAGPSNITCQVTSLTSANVNSVTLHYSTDLGQTYTPVTLVDQGGGAYQGQIPDVGSPTVVRYYIEALDDQGAGDRLPPGQPDFDYRVGVEWNTAQYDFEGLSDEGWTHTELIAEGGWQRGIPLGRAGDPPADGPLGLRCWGTDIGESGFDGYYEGNHTTSLRSPVYDLSGETYVRLEFRRWLTVEGSHSDHAQVRVNGAVIWENPLREDLIDTNWVAQSFDITDLAADNPAVRIEFHLASDSNVEFGGWNVDDVALVTLRSFDCSAPTNYCGTSPNSAGTGAVMGYSGSPSLSANDLVLVARGAPPSTAGLFYYGAGQTSVPFGDGFRCVGAGGAGIFRLSPAQMTNGFGEVVRAVNNDSPPANAGAGQLTVGSTWNFQFWFRDVPAGGTGFNLTDGLSATFCP